MKFHKREIKEWNSDFKRSSEKDPDLKCILNIYSCFSSTMSAQTNTAILLQFRYSRKTRCFFNFESKRFVAFSTLNWTTWIRTRKAQKIVRNIGMEYVRFEFLELILYFLFVQHRLRWDSATRNSPKNKNKIFLIKQFETTLKCKTLSLKIYSISLTKWA